MHGLISGRSDGFIKVSIRGKIHPGNRKKIKTKTQRKRDWQCKRTERRKETPEFQERIREEYPKKDAEVGRTKTKISLTARIKRKQENVLKPR